MTYKRKCYLIYRIFLQMAVSMVLDKLNSSDQVQPKSLEAKSSQKGWFKNLGVFERTLIVSGIITAIATMTFVVLGLVGFAVSAPVLISIGYIGVAVCGALGLALLVSTLVRLCVLHCQSSTPSSPAPHTFVHQKDLGTSV
ncbi:hypothetical protein [Chlamydia ibidis]|nr:hypothetical protein [Chlamydia ibidis]